MFLKLRGQIYLFVFYFPTLFPMKYHSYKNSFVLSLLFLAGASFYPSISRTQSSGFYQFMRTDSIPVFEGIQSLKNAWAGGINFSQVYNIDLNYDGIQDLVFFDRSGYKIMPFLQMHAAPLSRFSYAPQYKSAFPAALRDWIVLRDYNLDGKTDIFAYASGSCAVYENVGNAVTGLAFQLKKSPLMSFTGIITQSIFITSDDVPGIADVDLDGDIDILTFNNLGQCVQFHRNMSQENFGHSDSLQFILETDNWGQFSEGATGNTIVLDDDCSSKQNKMDGASSFFVQDLNNDGLVECVLGDQNYPNLILLHNDGTPTQAHMYAQDGQFPKFTQQSQPVHLSIFPAAFYADINNDGISDLLVTPQGSNRSENKKSVLAYINQGTQVLPDFDFLQEDFLQESMVDLGEGAYPAFIDYDGDGLKDLVVGNHGYFISPTQYSGQLALFKNTGNSTQAAFTLIDSDFGGLSNSGLQSIRPAFGDLDGDGKTDMIIGEKNGKLHYYKNQATGGQPANFVLDSPNFMGIQSQQFAAPFLFDLNEDGKLDLLVGHIRGWVDYYENLGTVQQAQFSSSPTLTKIGGVNVVDSSISLNGFSVPTVIADGNDFHLLVGSYSGKIVHYSHLKQNLWGNFTRVTTNLGGIPREGMRSAVAAGDIDGDAKWDIIIGNYSGGLAAYLGQSVNTSIIGYEQKQEVKLYPNPVASMLTVEHPGMQGGNYRISDMTGRICIEGRSEGGEKIDINTEYLRNGIYIFHWYTNAGPANFGTIFMVQH